MDYQRLLWMTGRSFSGKGVLVSAGARAADTGPTNLIVLLKKEDIEFERGSLRGRGVPAPTPGITPWIMKISSFLEQVCKVLRL